MSGTRPSAIADRPLLLLVALLVACGQETNRGGPTESGSHELVSPAGPGSGQPHLATTPDGSVVMSWLEPAGTGHALRHSRLSAHGWEEASTIAEGDDWFVNWADFPSVVPISDTLWAAHWLVKSADSAYAYDVMMTVSSDAGSTWATSFSPHDDGTPTEHGFVSLFARRDAIGALWLDGRNMAATHGEGSGGMTLRAALIGPDGIRMEETVVDPLVCDCCQTDAVATSSGTLVAYRDRSTEEIRDIHTARVSAAGWQALGSVHDDGWRIAGCPVNGPALWSQDERVAIAWFTAAREPTVLLARSDDGGRRFDRPVTIDREAPLGRVDVAGLPGGDTIVSWVRRAETAAGRIWLRRVGADGSTGRAIAVSAPEPARQIGFPQIILSGESLVLAWTTATEDGSHRVRSVRLETAAIP